VDVNENKFATFGDTGRANFNTIWPSKADVLVVQQILSAIFMGRIYGRYC